MRQTDVLMLTVIVITDAFLAVWVDHSASDKKLLVMEMAAMRSSGTGKVNCGSQVPRHDFFTHIETYHKV